MIFEKLQLKQWPSVHHIRIKRHLFRHLTPSWPILLLLSIIFYSKLRSKRRSPKIIGKIGRKMANFVHVATSFSLDPTQRAQWVGQSAENLADCFHRPHKQDVRQIIWRTLLIDPIN